MTYPLVHRANKRARVDLDGNEKNLEVAATLADLWERGFDSALLRNYTTPDGKTGQKILVVKDPSQLRSPNAAFDPKKRHLSALEALDQLPSSGQAGDARLVVTTVTASAFER